MRKSLGCSIAIFVAIFSGSVYAQGTPLDQYKQMGGIAALAQKCYGSLEIPSKLKPLIIDAIFANPKTAGLLEPLITGYKEAHDKALENHTLWVGPNYSKRPFLCSDSKDMKLLKTLEKSTTKNLK